MLLAIVTILYAQSPSADSNPLPGAEMINNFLDSTIGTPKQVLERAGRNTTDGKPLRNNTEQLGVANTTGTSNTSTASAANATSVKKTDSKTSRAGENTMPIIGLIAYMVLPIMS